MKLLAALIFFTRLPFWRIAEVPAVYFKRVVDSWPLVGWLTGGTMAAVLWGAAQVFPLSVAVLLAIVVRMLITGALHEDGLADFCDGFGGGTSREKILAIMKDSHIGTYGVIGLMAYVGLLWTSLSTLPFPLACAAVWGGDAWSKCCAAQVINVLPYARKEEESKAKVVYDRMTMGTWAGVLLAGVLPLLVVLDMTYWWAGLAPVLTAACLIGWIGKRIQGYTGDCCGAIFLLSELSFYLAVNLIHTNL